MNGFHHVRARIRGIEGLEPFPSEDKGKRTLDYLMYAVGIGAPLALLPQIIQIYSTKSAVGISLPTWLLLTCFNLLWVLYGAVHKDGHILFANMLMFFFNCTIVAGVVLY